VVHHRADRDRDTAERLSACGGRGAVERPLTGAALAFRCYSVRGVLSNFREMARSSRSRCGKRPSTGGPKLKVGAIVKASNGSANLSNFEGKRILRIDFEPQI
jgi:hypothetical protein